MDYNENNPQTVVDMSNFVQDPSFSILSQIESYWEALRGLRSMPKRADINPRGIERALENTFILERIAPGMARLRIAGSHLSDLMGMEVRGMPITSFITPDCRRQVSDTLEEVFQRPAVCELRLSADSSYDKPPMEARMLLLPLKSDLGDVSRVLGCFVAQGTIGRCPRRFNIVGVKIRPVTPAKKDGRTEPPITSPSPMKSPKTTTAAQSTNTSEGAGFSEPKSDFTPKTQQSGVPYLRLVKSD